MALEQGGRLRIGLFAVVQHFAHLDDFEIGGFLRQDMAETHLALLMAAIGERAREQRHLAWPAGAHEAVEQIPGQPARSAVIDADIGDARHMQDVGGDSDDLDVAGR